MVNQAVRSGCSRDFGVLTLIVILAATPSWAGTYSYGRASSITLDGFRTSQYVVATGQGSCAGDSVQGPGIIGLERDVYVEVLSGYFSLKVLVNNLGADEFYAHSQDPTVRGYSLTVWDGPDQDPYSVAYEGLNGLDLTVAGNQEALKLRVLWLDVPCQLKVTIYSNELNASSYLLSLPGLISTPTDYVMGYSQFEIEVGAGADFTTVGAITLMVFGSQIGTDIRFDLFQTTATYVGDLVWLDSNANGVQEAGEPGFGEVPLTLLDPGGGVVDTTVSDDKGFYQFVVPTGEYAIRVIPPQPYTFSPQDQGADDALDSDINQVTWQTDYFPVLSGQNDASRDVGLFNPIIPTATQLPPSTTPLPPTTTPSPTPTKPFPIPTSVAEVVVGAYDPTLNCDVVRVWALSDRDVPEFGIVKGDRLEPARILLTAETDPAINGQITDIFTAKIFPDSNYHNDIVVLTSGADDLSAPNLFVFRNANDDSVADEGLQYVLADAIRAESALPSMPDVVAIEPKFVRILNVDNDVYQKMEVAVFFNLTMTTEEHQGYVLVYNNLRNNPLEFEFNPLGFSDYFYQVPDPGRILDVAVANIDNRLQYNTVPDDFALLLSPEQVGEELRVDHTVYLVIRSTSGVGFSLKTAFALEGNVMPTGLEVGDFYKFEDQPPGFYPDFAFISGSVLLITYQNNYDRSILPPGDPGHPSMRTTMFADGPIIGIHGVDFYNPYYIDDLVINMEPALSNSANDEALRGDTTTVYRTDLYGDFAAIEHLVVGQRPFMTRGGSISAPDQTVDILVVSRDPDPTFDSVRIQIGLQVANPPNPYGIMIFNPTREQRSLPGPGVIRKVEFSQHAGGIAPP